MDKNERQRIYREKTGNSCTKKYERTKSGKLMRSYRNMQSRVTGVQWRKSHLYEGKEILDRDSFYSWSLSNNDFNTLYDNWVVSDYNRKLSPSVDRIDSSQGYVIGNMRWVTHSDNSRSGANSKYAKMRLDTFMKDI